jgi:hypothetical protein
MYYPHVTYLETCERTFVHSLIALTLTNNTRPEKTGLITNDKCIEGSGHVDNTNFITTHQSFSGITSIMKTWGRFHMSIYRALLYCQSDQRIGIPTHRAPFVLKYDH